MCGRTYEEFCRTWKGVQVRREEKTKGKSGKRERCPFIRPFRWGRYRLKRESQTCGKKAETATVYLFAKKGKKRKTSIRGSFERRDSRFIGTGPDGNTGEIRKEERGEEIRL